MLAIVCWFQCLVHAVLLSSSTVSVQGQSISVDTIFAFYYLIFFFFFFEKGGQHKHPCMKILGFFYFLFPQSNSNNKFINSYRQQVCKVSMCKKLHTKMQRHLEYSKHTLRNTILTFSGDNLTVLCAIYLNV